jgi:uncharacterized protein YkwD
MSFDRSKAVQMLTTVAILAVFGSPVFAQKSAEKKRIERMIDQLVEGHNKERSKEGLPPLKLEDRLTEAALAHAKDMAQQEVMTHDGSDGSHPNERVSRTGYRYLNTGENVAKGYKTVPEVMKAWMISPPHKKNILGDYSEIGLAVVYGEDGRSYWCTEFGKPFPHFEPVSASNDLVTRINDERTTAKKPTMTKDERLTKAAQEQAEKLAKANNKERSAASFEGIDRKLFPDLAISAASGHPDAESMTKTLMETPRLKDQILGKFTRIGAGYATSEDGTPYWCLILGKTPQPISK